MNNSVEFILASQSPRRQHLLQKIGIPFTVMPASVDETIDPKYTPEELVVHLAFKKAQAISKKKPDALILGADTLVVSHGMIFGKPQDDHDARKMLKSLSGEPHTVHTGIALVHHQSDRVVTAVETTEVIFGDLTDSEILNYVKTQQPLDKAGGYGIQDDFGVLLIECTNGDFYNVVGLPLRRLYVLLTQHFDDLIKIY